MQTSVTRDGSGTVVQFTRALDATFTGEGEVPLIVAKGSDATVQAHALSDREGFAAPLTAAGGDVSAAGGATRIVKLYRAHAWLMVIGWGVLLPLGIIIAATSKSWGAAWCAASRVVLVCLLRCCSAAGRSGSCCSCAAFGVMSLLNCCHRLRRRSLLPARTLKMCVSQGFCHASSTTLCFLFSRLACHQACT